MDLGCRCYWIEVLCAVVFHQSMICSVSYVFSHLISAIIRLLVCYHCLMVTCLIT